MSQYIVFTVAMYLYGMAQTTEKNKLFRFKFARNTSIINFECSFYHIFFVSVVKSGFIYSNVLTFNSINFVKNFRGYLNNLLSSSIFCGNFFSLYFLTIPMKIKSNYILLHPGLSSFPSIECICMTT